MAILGNILVLIVAFLHIGFMIMEMYLWQTPAIMQRLGMSPEQASATAVLAANQGLYNGFLAAGLFWGVIAERENFAIKVFFLTCVIMAGVFGGLTAKASIVVTQAVPAISALAFVILARGRSESA
ncbi:MAG TPA: DUF1304 domain-containing protein [Alphaproteobacteria bacterium]|nr:DUF1304 domain-containing protein [Alphaproteobacteria bacterium]HAJ45562.1 DUF1304 domain-containing protein [Alphaproteobacteria bacterium]